MVASTEPDVIPTVDQEHVLIGDGKLTCVL